MKTLFICIIGFTLIGGFSSMTTAQRGFQDFETDQGIKIQYRWARTNFFDKNSDAGLTLRLTNETDQYVEVTFNISFYRDQQLMFQNSDNNICLRPGQSRRGSPAGLRFSAEGVSMDMISEQWFSWDVSQLEVIVVDSCN